MAENPFDWQGETPRHRLHRPMLDDLRRALLDGEGVCVLGGHGMGKSVLISMLEESLSAEPGVCCVSMRAPPLELTTAAALANIASALQVNGEPDMDEIFGMFQRRGDAQLILLFDELDSYVRVPDCARTLFNHLESVRRRARRRLGILTAGGLGALVLRDHLGSDFLSRAKMHILTPLAHEELESLARPFSEGPRASALDAETLDAVRLTTGGNPALVTYAYQRLWRESVRTPGTVAASFFEFEADHGEFIRAVHGSVLDSPLTATVRRIYDVIRERGGEIPRRSLLECCERSGQLHIELRDALQLLTSAGLIEVHSSLAADPLLVRPLQSILALPREREHDSSQTSPWSLLRADLFRLLGLVQRTSPDFFRHGGELVPEAVFSSVLCLGLRLIGWRAERESLEGGGEVDLKVELAASPTPSYAIIELKRWSNPDYRSVHAQVERYWSTDVDAGAVIVIAGLIDSGTLGSWREKYVAECLAPYECEIEELEVPSALHCGLRARSSLANGASVEVDHLLLNLRRRPR